MRIRQHLLFAILGGAFVTTAHSAVLLESYNFGGPQQTVRWDAAQSGGAVVAGGALSSTGGAGSIPTAGVGTATVGGGGFPSSSGFYSPMGNFSMTASTSIQNTAFSDIMNVVFQRVSMDTGGTPASVDANLNLGGGPTLSYFIDGSSTASGTLAATYFAVGDDSLAGGQGTYRTFIYQFDLSGIAGNVTGVSILAPIPIHSSTVESQIDIGGGSFVQVIPEPASAGLMGIGLVGLLIRRRR